MTLSREEKLALSRYRLEKADRLLADARLLLEQRRWESAVNRTYYAAFSAARGVLILFGGEPRSHEGVKTLVNQKLVLGGYLTKEYGRWFRDLLADREEADSADYVLIEEKDAAEAVERGEKFVEEAKRIAERVSREL